MPCVFPRSCPLFILTMRSFLFSSSTLSCVCRGISWSCILSSCSLGVGGSLVPLAMRVYIGDQVLYIFRWVVCIWRGAIPGLLPHRRGSSLSLTVVWVVLPFLILLGPGLGWPVCKCWLVEVQVLVLPSFPSLRGLAGLLDCPFPLWYEDLMDVVLPSAVVVTLVVALGLFLLFWLSLFLALLKRVLGLWQTWLLKTFIKFWSDCF